MNKYRIVILLLLILSFINAQTDVGLWTSFSVEKPVLRSFLLNYSEELRFANSSGNLNNIRSSLAVNYMISKKTELRYAWQDKSLFLTNEDGYFSQPFVRWAVEIKRPVVKSLTASIK